MTGDPLIEVRRLFSLAEREVTWEEIEKTGSPAITVGIGPGATFTLRGEAYYLLEDLSEMIARPGYAAPGLGLEGARTMLMGACTRFLRDGPDSAASWLLGRLHSSPDRWKVIRPIDLLAHDTPFTVGGARIQRGLPDEAREENDELLHADFPAFSIACEVAAWDRDAAILFADRVFQESIAILQLADRSGQPRLRSVAVTVSEGVRTYSHTTNRSGSVLSAVTPTGDLLGSLGVLSMAAQKQVQTEWERRTLAAARWLARGLGTSSPSDALVSFMTALEALFIPPQSSHKKKDKVAHAVSTLIRPRRMSPAELSDWLEDLYKRRNDVIHESLSYDDEIQVDRLADVAWLCVRWAANHLQPFHAFSDRPCESFREVRECDRRAQAAAS